MMLSDQDRNPMPSQSGADGSMKDRPSHELRNGTILLLTGGESETELINAPLYLTQ
jgi:hypothetical protein